MRPSVAWRRHPRRRTEGSSAVSVARSSRLRWSHMRTETFLNRLSGRTQSLAPGARGNSTNSDERTGREDAVLRAMMGSDSPPLEMAIEVFERQLDGRRAAVGARRGVVHPVGVGEQARQFLR